MILKGILYLVLIIFSAVFLIVSLIFTVVKFSSNGKQAARWLIGFVVSLLVLIFSIWMLVTGVVGKAKQFAGEIEGFGMEQAERMDSLNNLYTNSKDSLLESSSVNYLMSLEPDTMKGRVPQQFYSYLGFRDYYRLPLVWPYSLHCIESLNEGALYNEANVEQFDVNDNGELSCDLNGITHFAFNNELLIGKHADNRESSKKLYFAFDFNKKSEKTFSSEYQLIRFAIERGFSKDTKLISCKNYYNDF